MTKHIKIRGWVKIVILLVIIITFLILYSRYVGTKGLIIKENSIVDSNIPNNFYGLKIIQFSDIHYKVTTYKNDLEKIVNEINLLKPDIVIFNGDLFDESIKYKDTDYEDLKEILKNIDYEIGKYAIKGEQDLNNDKWDEIMSYSGFRNINNNYEFIYSNGLEPILLVGIESNYNDNHISNTLNDIYNNINIQYKYSILVLHEPDFIDYIDYNKFNLILAGHSHDGQIKLPYIGGIINKKYSSVYKNEYKFRLFNRPSINLFRLRNK